MDNKNLTGFTLLTQICVGLFGTTLCNIWAGQDIESHISFINLSICLGLITLGLIVAMAHLGNPKNAPRTLTNIAGSWLSREIITINFLAAGIGLLWSFTWLDILRNVLFIEIAVLIIGIFAVWTMSKVYGLKTVPVWNHLSTPMDFYGTVFLSGSIVFVMLDLFVLQEVSKPYLVPLIFSCLWLILKITAISSKIITQMRLKNVFWYASSRTKTGGHYKTLIILSVLYITGFVVFALANYGLPGNFLLYIVFSMGITLIAEIWHRHRFFDSFCRIGL